MLSSRPVLHEIFFPHAATESKTGFLKMFFFIIQFVLDLELNPKHSLTPSMKEAVLYNQHAFFINVNTPTRVASRKFIT